MEEGGSQLHIIRTPLCLTCKLKESSLAGLKIILFQKENFKKSFTLNKKKENKRRIKENEESW